MQAKSEINLINPNGWHRLVNQTVFIFFLIIGMTCKWKSLILLVTFNGHPVETIENVTISIFILVSFEKSFQDKVMSGTNYYD